MRCITSEPVPVLQRIGTRPAMMATTVIIFGRTRYIRSRRIPASCASNRSRTPSTQHHGEGLTPFDHGATLSVVIRLRWLIGMMRAGNITSPDE